MLNLTQPSSPFYEEVCFHYFVQYHLHLQLKEVSEYSTHVNGVGIKGDIAIGVSPKSVDTWVFPHLFRLNKSTGAPPDFFCKYCYRNTYLIYLVLKPRMDKTGDFQLTIGTKWQKMVTTGGNVDYTTWHNISKRNLCSLLRLFLFIQFLLI